MPKYLIIGSYTAEGMKGVLRDGGSKRRQAAENALKSVGGKVDCFYFSFGEHDTYIVIDAPDNTSIAAASMAIGATGAVRIKTVPLLTPAEIDEAAKKSIDYRAPGQ